MVKQRDNGEYVIKNVKQAKEAANLLAELKTELADPELVDMQNQATALAKALGAFMDKHATDKLESDRAKLTLVRPMVKCVAATHKEIPEALRDEITPLNSLLPDDIYKSVIKEVVDTEALEEALRSGDVALKDVEDAYFEKPNRPYVRTTVKK